MIECESLFKNALEEGRSSLLENEAKQICNLHHIPTPPHHVATNVGEAVEKAHETGFPVVLKIISPQILHKTDIGGVILNINDEQELKTRYSTLLSEMERKKPSAEIRGVLIEKMMPPSTEVIVGGLCDSQFGPSIMFGIGGIFTEIYEDVTFRVAPIDRGDALQMISELKGSKLLEGVRGNPPADIEAIIHVLLNVSKLMMEHDEVDQLDLNPVIVYKEGLFD